MRMLWALLVCPALSGCLGFAYPSFNHTPEIVVPDDTVRAFRKTSRFERSGCVIAGMVSFGSGIEEIPIKEQLLPIQHNNLVKYYYLCFPFTGCNDRTMCVYLYRPGYQVVEVEARSCLALLWERRLHEVKWEPAPDLPAQLNALRKIYDPNRDSECPEAVARLLAAEYRRLATAPDQTGQRSPEAVGELLKLAERYEGCAKAR